MTAPVLDEAALEVALRATGEWCDPYTAPRESGVAIDSDISQEDADQINKDAKERLAFVITAYLAAQPRAVAGEHIGLSPRMSGHTRECRANDGWPCDCGYVIGPSRLAVLEAVAREADVAQHNEFVHLNLRRALDALARLDPPTQESGT